jgi:hypothetical protein
MHKPRTTMLSWDWKEQPDLDTLGRVITTMSNGTVHLHQVDDGTDNITILLSDTPLDARAVLDAYDAACEPQAGTDLVELWLMHDTITPYEVREVWTNWARALIPPVGRVLYLSTFGPGNSSGTWKIRSVEQVRPDAYQVTLTDVDPSDPDPLEPIRRPEA